VHERVGVYELDGCGERIELFLGRADELAARVDEQRPHAFAAAEHGITHRLEQSLGDLTVGGENGGELLIDSAAVVLETLRKCVGRGPCYHREQS
jgi:hypothetical protein